MIEAGKILCVDDDPDILAWMDLVLGACGHQVTGVSIGAEAIERVASFKPDVILLDVTMPDMNGYELCARLQEKEEAAYVPVIFVTALSGEQDKAQALAAGGADYLVKPVDETGLIAKVEAHLNRRRQWQELRKSRQVPETARRPAGGETRWDVRLRPSEFARFKEFLSRHRALAPDRVEALQKLGATQVYRQAAQLGLTEEQVAESIAAFLRLSYVTSIEPSDVRLGVLPAPFCRANGVVAVGDPAAPPAFALSNPFLWEVVDTLRSVSGREQPRLVIAEPRVLEDLLAPQKVSRRVNLAQIQAQLQKEYGPEVRVSEIAEATSEKSAPIIQLVNTLIESAHKSRASDIHIEPAETEVVVRYRIDGDLHVMHRLRPPTLIRPIIARLKIMAALDITEHRLPQDGRIRFGDYGPQDLDLDLRLAIAPMHLGEKAVLRLLDRKKSVMPLEGLGFSAGNLRLYRERIRAPYGMILHTGPTGSGKSMSLYAALNEISNPSINIHTAEDPIEYTLPGINQLQVNAEVGLTFARALRSFLRLDPDVILVGEIRDQETARIALEASLTGHLLLSTLHTNDAASAVVRLVEMGIEPYLVSSSLLMVCAQRLLRRLCPECKQAYEPSGLERKRMGLRDDEPAVLYRPVGCAHCNRIGYFGRLAVHEILVPDDAFRSAMNEKGVTSEGLKRISVERGMTTLYWDAMEKVLQGVCSLEDVLGNIRPDEYETRPRQAVAERNDKSGTLQTGMTATDDQETHAFKVV
jgi:type IV pilus assembly protein PilB